MSCVVSNVHSSRPSETASLYVMRAVRSGASFCGATAMTLAVAGTGAGAECSSSACATIAIVRIATPTVCPSIE